MPITGRFEADFSSFQSAVNAAESTLSGFESRSGKVESSLNRMGNSLSGTKLIQDAVLMAKAVDDLGGTSKLTDAELERLGKQAQEAADKMRALGLNVPDNLRRIATEARNAESVLSDLEREVLAAFSTAAIVQFGRDILETGDKIVKMADQTGLTYDQVQRLSYVSGQTSTSVESLVGAVQNLQQKLGSDDEGAAGAMRKLGINTEAFLKLDTYSQLTTAGSALQGLKSDTERAELASALFGKTWKEILPAIKSGIKEVGDAAPVMADQVVLSIDRIGDALRRSKDQATVWGAGLVLALEGAGFAVGDFLSSFDPEHFGVTNSQLLKLQTSLADPSNGLLGALGAIKPPTVAFTAEVVKLGLSFEEAARQDKLLENQARLSMEATKERAREARVTADAVLDALKDEYAGYQRQKQILLDVQAAQKKASDEWAATLKKVEDQSKSFQDRLESVDGTIVEWAEHLLQSGVDAKTVAEYYGLTDGQVRALTEDLRRASEAAKAAGDGMSSNLLIVGKSADEAAAKVDKLYQTFQLLGQGMGLTLGQTVTPTGRLLPNDPNVGESNVSGVFAQAMAVPRFAGGVENFRGGAAIVGEAGPELVNLPRGSSVTPAGRFGGGSTIVVQNTFHIVDTASNVARQAADQILASIKRASLLTAS